jgi:CDP-glucose 4,6-dehydratase
MEMTSALSALRGKRVFVTGDTGFKGSWLCLWLQQLGARVSGFALAPRSPRDHFTLLNLPGVIEHTEGDIRDLAALERAVTRAEPEVFLHLAAQSLVRTSYADPKTTFDTNVGGSVNVLEAVRRTPSVRSLVFITSDKCYRNREWIWGYRENDELGGHDPYSASKAAAELVFASYRDSFLEARAGLGVASVRAGNVIGGGDWSDNRIVPDCIRALEAKQPIVLRNPLATRPWQHVLEPLSGYLFLATRLLAEPKRYSGSWNFGPHSDSAHTVKDLADQIVAHWGSGEVRVERDPNAPAECGLLHLNCDKAHLELGWRARWDFHRAARETALWYKQIKDGVAATEVSGRQIAAYLDTQP